MRDSNIIAVLVATECLEVGLNTLGKAAMRAGMSTYVFVVYSCLVGSLFLLPTTFIFRRIRGPPPQLTYKIISKIFFLSFICCSLQMFTFTGIQYSSPSLASAMTNLTPAYTYILAVIFRMERLDFKAKSSRAKLIGTIVSIIGAFVVTLYKGPKIMLSSLPSSPTHDRGQLLSSPSNWIIGGILLTVAYLFKALVYITQTWIMKDYPAELMVTLISSVFETIISTIISLIAENDSNAWKLRPNIALITIVFSGIYGVSLRNIAHIWALHKKGPVYVTMFKPLGIIIAAAMGIAFLGDKLYLGSVIGAAVIAIGFYSVMWGKARENKITEDDAPRSNSYKVPLLR